MSALAPTRIRVVAGIAVFVLLAGYAIAMRPAHRSPIGGDGIARVGSEAPELSVMLEDGRASRLSAVVQGRRAVVVFFSPVCGVCEVTLPSLQPFPASLQLVMVDVSGTEKARSSLIRRDSRAIAASKLEVQRMFPFSGLPTIVFINERSVVTAGLAGSQPKGRIQAALMEFSQNVQ